MAKNQLLTVVFEGEEIGLLGYDENLKKSSFQYNPSFLKTNKWLNLFPLIIRRIQPTQVFSQFHSDTFRGLPPLFADSLPDMFGNIIFKAWMETTSKDFESISVLEQLAYIGNRGMGALEYHPSKKVPLDATIDISEMAHLVKQVFEQKQSTFEDSMNHAALLTIFKIGSSAGGMRPKILVSENIATGAIVPGDLLTDIYHRHYLVKLDIGDQKGYSREAVEYCYWLAAKSVGIDMMDAKLIDNKHFATLRFDRMNGSKIHTLTVSGLTGLDHTKPADSAYENIFDLMLFLKCPHKDVEQLFRRMVFNLVFANHDDHLKNHSFVYNSDTDAWRLGPAYDLTYSLNPELDFLNHSRALSINGKRVDILWKDVEAVAKKYAVKQYKKVIQEIQDTIPFFVKSALSHGVPKRIVDLMQRRMMG
jgi:serine/threonine-protein kinase HipA